MERHTGLTNAGGCRDCSELMNDIPRQEVDIIVRQRYLHTTYSTVQSVFRIGIHRIHMFLCLLDPDPDPLVRGMDPDQDPSIIKQK